MTLGSVVAQTACDLEPGNRHLALAGCDHCDTRTLARLTLAQAEDGYNRGYYRQAMYEAYMHVWATGAVRFSSLADGWETPPTDPEVTALVALIRTALEEKS